MARQISNRILLDTNVWNYLADHSNAAALAAAARAGGATVVVAPAVIYEALAVTDPVTLHARSRLLTDERWKRLMPEAYSECQEVLGQIRRLRPDWLLQQPPRRDFQLLFRDWRRNGTGFWARVRAHPQEASKHVRELQQGLLQLARVETKAARKKQINNDYPVWSAPLNKYWSEVPSQLGANEKISVAAWRHDALLFWTRHLGGVIGQPTPLDYVGGYVDWLSAELSFDSVKANDHSWYRFWLFDISDDAMPRSWLRWASGLLQQFSRWSPGTPGDNALSAYLMDADWFVTADAGLYRIVKKVHADAPFRVASPLLISADKVGAAQALDVVAAGEGTGDRFLKT